MLRKLLFAVLCVAVAAVCVGCGGPDITKVRPAEDLGDPADFAMGATDLGQRAWLIKHDVDGETRIWVLIATVPGLVSSESLKYDTGLKVFHDKGRRRKYNIDGTPQHRIIKGPNKGKEASSLTRKKVELAPETGNLLLYRSIIIRNKADKNDPDKGGYIVIQ